MRRGKISGIQKQYLLNMLALLILALLLSSIGVWVYVRRNMSNVILDNYEFVTEKMGINLDRMYQKSEEITAECIINESVQQSLMAQELETVEKNALSKYFAYIDLDHVADYCYVDNKGNVYTKSYSNITYEDFADSGFAEILSRSYARTEWFYQKDVLFHTGEYALFIGRNVQSMEYASEPGMLILKMDDEFLQSAAEDRSAIQDAAVGIVDWEGNFCMEYYPEDFVMSPEALEAIGKLARGSETGMICSRQQVQGGILQAYRQGESGLMIFTLVPDAVLSEGFTQILLVLLGIYLLVILIAVGISLYISKRLTSPIQQISQKMTGFDGTDFTQTLDIHTNTELDQIGQAYNEMLVNIEELLEEIKKQEKELRTSELNMLISQINPHFLYNTLDTIYMLARINGEATTMKMIHALSSYLRLSLSKGNDMVTVADELENVKSYMEIQQIRNPELFSYEIDCQVEEQERWVLKLILQPLVENAVKYGFSELFEGGRIRIEVREEEGQLVLSVFNNGIPIRPEMAEKLNTLDVLPVVELKHVFPDKKQGYGIVNIITRLRLKYGEGVKVRYEGLPEGTRCTIWLPGDGKENDEV